MKQFEEIITAVGEFGRYQKLQFMVIWLIGGGSAFFQLGNTFFSASADHYCKVYDNQTFVDKSPLKNCTIPYSLQGEGISWDKCQRYDLNVSQGIFTSLCPSGIEETVSCDQGWVYDQTWYENTVVLEYDLVCTKDWMKQLTKSIVPLGNLVGVFIFGQLADLFGRKPIFFVNLILTIITAIVTSFSPSYAVFVVGQFFLGAFPHSLFVTGNVIVMETVGLRHRTMCGSLVHSGFTVHYVLFGIIALLWRGDWRRLLLIAGLFWIIYVPFFFFILETPVWLMRKRKYEKAEKVLKRFAQFNKTTLPENVFEGSKANTKSEGEASQKETKRYTVLDLIRTPTLRFRTIVMCFNWFSVSLVYYGIALNTDKLGSNPYVTFIISGSVGFPGILLSWLLMRVVGRRWTLCGLAVVGGVALMLSVLPKIDELTVAVAMAAQTCIGGVFVTVFVYGAELYPTVVRNSGMGLSSVSARIGSIISPFVVLLDVYWGPLPFIVMGVTSVIAGLLALSLPETRNKRLPNTLYEGQTFGTNDIGAKEEKVSMMDEGQQTDNELCKLPGGTELLHITLSEDDRSGEINKGFE